MPILATKSGQKPIDWFQEVSRSLSESVEKYDLLSSPAWSDLDSLSSRTVIEEFEVSEDVIYEDGGYFFAPASVHVRLNYSNGDDAFSISESFYARVKFSVDGDEEHGWSVSIEDVQIDTSSFYA